MEHAQKMYYRHDYTFTIIMMMEDIHHAKSVVSLIYCKMPDFTENKTLGKSRVQWKQDLGFTFEDYE